MSTARPGAAEMRAPSPSGRAWWPERAASTQAMTRTAARSFAHGAPKIANLSSPSVRASSKTAPSKSSTAFFRAFLDFRKNMKQLVSRIKSTMSFMPFAVNRARQSGGTFTTRASPAKAGGSSSRLAPLHSNARPKTATNWLANHRCSRLPTRTAHGTSPASPSPSAGPTSSRGRITKLSERPPPSAPGRWRSMGCCRSFGSVAPWMPSG
mmetsp:Transcript_2028/g.5739  ORF Transcript_2028/g.5739 Transcript_2028/m.5739 type:complete len:210 (-) Transcript_2028:18-647(-)